MTKRSTDIYQTELGHISLKFNSILMQMDATCRPAHYTYYLLDLKLLYLQLKLSHSEVI